MTLPKQLPYRTVFSLVFVIASLWMVAISPAQTTPLDEFAIPADNSDDATADEKVPVTDDNMSEGVADEGKPGEEPFDNSFFDEFTVEDVAPENEDAPVEENDLTLWPDAEEKDVEDTGAEKKDSDIKENNEPASAAGSADDPVMGTEELQPIPEFFPNEKAKTEELADQPLAEREPGVKQPTSWLSRGGGICSHWVRLTPEGRLRGEINLLQQGGPERGVGSLKVAIYRNGKRVGEDVTNEAGQFSFREVKSGVYSLLVSGPGGFAAYGVHVLAPLEQSLFGRADIKGRSDERSPDKEDVGHNRLPHDDFVRFAQVVRKPPSGVKVKETLRVTTAAVPPTSFGALRSIIQDYGNNLTIQDTVPPQSIPQDAWDELIATAIKEKKPGFDEAEGPEMYRGTKELEKNPVKHVRSPALGNFNVPLERCGDQLVMCGRMVDTDPGNGRPLEVEAESTTLTLIRNDQRVATTMVREGGTFEFLGLTPGIYSIVAVGDVGFGAISFRAVAPAEPEQASHKKSNIHFVQYPLNDVPDVVTSDLSGVGASGVPGAVTSEMPIDDGCCCCDPMGAEGSNAVIGGASFGSGGGGVAVPLCCDPACKRDAVAFFRPLLAAASIVVPAVALAADAPVELGGAPVSSGGFQGTVGGGGGAAGIGLGLGALGVGIAAALDDDEPVSPVLP